MKGNKSLIKANNLSPSVEGSRDFKKISQIFDVKNFSQKTETPFILIVCNQFLDILGFDTLRFFIKVAFTLSHCLAASANHRFKVAG